ncbi:MAG: hypothetical protein RL637_716 [Pseudomonadota bacterium]|jgi:serine O-acetyltransferase
MSLFQQLREDIDCVFDRDPAAQTVFEVITCYPGFHAILIHRLSHYCWQQGWRWLGRFISHCGRWLTGIEIHPGAQLGRRLFIDHGMGIVIGETAVIGDDCTLYHSVTLGGTSWKKGKRHPTLGNGVVIGAGAKVLGPIMIGDQARVGSNSVVLKNVPPAATVVGIPAHLVDKSNTAHQRDSLANQSRFQAYGTAADMPDPIAQAINQMLDHIHQMDKQVEAMQQALIVAGIECPIAKVSQLEACEINDTQE